MKKTGFTLSELLITLGIIGIVAALTTPAIVKNTGNSKLGPSLAKFVNTFDNAAQAVLFDKNTTSLSSVGTNAEIMDELSKHMTMAKTDAEYSLPSNTPAIGGSTITNKYLLKDGALIATLSAQSLNSVAEYSAQGSFKGNQMLLLYDVDGANGKNTPGKDIFVFIVDKGGSLIPWGGETHRLLNERVGANNCTSSNLTPSCTGRIADNNWKANY